MRSLITDVTKGFLRVYIATRQQIAQNKDELPLPTLSLPLPAQSQAKLASKNYFFHFSFSVFFLDCSPSRVIFRVVGDRK